MQSLFRICLLPWTTTTCWRQSIVTRNLCSYEGGWVYPQIPCDCHFSSVCSGPQKIKLKIVKSLLISILSSFPFLFFLFSFFFFLFSFFFFLSSFFCNHVCTAQWRLLQIEDTATHSWSLDLLFCVQLADTFSALQLACLAIFRQKPEFQGV